MKKKRKKSIRKKSRAHPTIIFNKKKNPTEMFLNLNGQIFEATGFHNG